MLIFVYRNRKPSIPNTKKIKFQIIGSGVSGAGWRKWVSDLDSSGQRTPEYLLNPENSVIPKIQSW